MSAKKLVGKLLASLLIAVLAGFGLTIGCLAALRFSGILEILS